jgi:hypothetical protein
MNKFRKFLNIHDKVIFMTSPGHVEMLKFLSQNKTIYKSVNQNLKFEISKNGNIDYIVIVKVHS